MTTEIGLLFPADTTQIGRYERDRTVSSIARWSKPGTDPPPVARWKLGGHNVTTLVAETGRPARIDNRADGTGEIGSEARAAGARTSVGAPIVVEGELWGVAIATSTGGRRFRGDTEARLAAFTELVATAIANAESRDELAASRARVLAAADEARRRIERDLHDGTQQRLTALALALRATEAAVPPEMTDIRTQLSRTAKGLAAAVDDLQEISRGIHPAILSKGGLGPAIKALARRSAIPVELELNSDHAVAGADRGRRVLRRIGGAHQRGQAFPRVRSTRRRRNRRFGRADLDPRRRRRRRRSQPRVGTHRFTRPRRVARRNVRDQQQ